MGCMIWSVVGIDMSGNSIVYIVEKRIYTNSKSRRIVECSIYWI